MITKARYYVYLIHEMTKRGDSFYVGYTKDPFRRWKDHQKKRYTVKCHRCHGTGEETVTDAMTDEIIVQTCSACAGSLRVPGKRKNLGPMKIYPNSIGKEPNERISYHLDTVKEAMARERSMKHWKKYQKNWAYNDKMLAKTIFEVLEMEGKEHDI
jgi:predicted GIY-YIG superfamily endonuclease